MKAIQTAVGALIAAALGLWLFGGYDAAGIEATLTSWVELAIRLLITAAMIFFFLQSMSVAFDALSSGRPREAIVLAVVGVVILFAMPMVARMVTVNAAQELNRTLVESEPFVDTAAQNVVRIIRQRDMVLTEPATPTAVPAPQQPIITNLVATPQQTIVITTTTVPAQQVIEVPYDIRTWNPATPPPKPEE